MEHHPTLAPSSFPALKICGHFTPTGIGNDFTERGDRVHKLTADLCEPENIVKYELVRDEEECARWMAEKTLGILGGVQGISERVAISDPITGEVITYGTLDCWGWGFVKERPPYPELIDWKTGFPDAYRPQLSMYALGLMDKLKIDKVRCHLLYGDQKKVDRFIVTRDNAEMMLAEILNMQADSDAPYVQSKYCARCSVRPHCPAWTGLAAQAMGVVEKYDEFREGLEVIVRDPNKLGRFIKAWRSLNQLVEDHDVTKMAIGYIEHGTPVGNYEVRERKGKREYARDSVATLLELIREGDIGVDEAAAMFKLDPKEVDTFFKEKGIVCPINTITKGTYKILCEKNGR